MKILSEKNCAKYGNCVHWLRDRLPELPYGLWDLDDKRNIINSSKPVVGSGAMSADGVWFAHKGKKVFSGHVALVTKVKDDIITIQEANYKYCTVTEREGTKDKLKLIGFFVPERLKIKEKTMENHEVKKIIKVAKEVLNIDAGDRINKREDDEIAHEIEKTSRDYMKLVSKNGTLAREKESLASQLSTLRLNSIDEMREWKDKVIRLKGELEESIEEKQEVIIKEPETWKELLGVILSKIEKFLTNNLK